MKRNFLTVAALVLLAGFAVWEFKSQRASTPRHTGGPAFARQRSAAAFPAGRPAERFNPNPPGPAVPIDDAPSHLADDLNSPDTDIRADLRLLNDIFMHYRSATHGENPIGENADITEVLTGRNKLGYAFIPKSCPAIDSRGELCDRWGTPFFFHQLSGEEMEIRSAGPDRKMWTADDRVLTPGDE